MKAAVYYETGAPDVFRYEEVPDPICPAAGVLLDVKAVSIEGGDVLNRAGGEMPSKPHIVGYQCVGIVREAGESVTDRKLDRLKEFGLDHGINYKTDDFAVKARQLTGGRGVDLVVDSVGTTLAGSIEATAYKGRVVVVGNAGRAEDRRIDVSTLSQMN